MKIVIRTDASINIGSGHVMRCLTLAQKLKSQGASVTFVCQELEGNLCEQIQQAGFDLVSFPFNKIKSEAIDKSDLYASWLAIPMLTEIAQTSAALKSLEQVDWLIVDHYALDHTWEKAMRPYVGSIMVIDDLANRQHDCELLLDQNFYKNLGTRYDSLVKPETKLLLGPEYALLRDEFVSVKVDQSELKNTLQRILVFFGGIDTTNETKKAMDALKLHPEIIVDVVVGAKNPNRNEIEQEVSKFQNMNYYCQVDNMAELMAGSDLIIGGGGSTTLERYWLGLPSIVWSIAENQNEVAQSAADMGVSIYLGEHQTVTKAMITKTVSELVSSPERLKRMSKAALKLMGDRSESGCEKLSRIMKDIEYA